MCTQVLVKVQESIFTSEKNVCKAFKCSLSCEILLGQYQIEMEMKKR